MPLKMTLEQITNIQTKYRDLLNYQSPDVLSPINPLIYRDAGGDSLLHIAAARGDIETAITLLDAGIDPNLLGDMGSTPLHYAAEHKNFKICLLLLKFGADREIANEFGERPTLEFLDHS